MEGDVRLAQPQKCVLRAGIRGLVLLLCAVVAGCGGGSGLSEVFESDTYFSTSPYGDRLRAVAECVGLEPLVAVKVRSEPVMPCPSGRLCCLASHGYRDCQDGSGNLCGVAGLFDPESLTIRLPDGCDDALEHEYVHALLYQHGLSWRNHSHPAFGCQ